MNIIKKYRVLIIIAIVLLVSGGVIYTISQQDSNKVKLSSLSSFSVRQMLAKNNELFYYNGSQIVRSDINNNNKSQVIDNDVVFVSPSINGKRLYYVKGLGKNAKSYILNLDQNTKREYPQYGAFFWVNNDGKFVEFAKNNSNILNESLVVEYRNLPYPTFDSYAGIVLGSTVKTTPELEGYKWSVVNNGSTNFKTLEINNSISRPWAVSQFLVYLDEDNKFTTINQQGQKVVTNESIIQSQITHEDSQEQLFAKFDKNKIIIGSINLSDGKVSNKNSYKIEKLIKDNSIDTTKQTQAFLYNNILYIMVDNKVLEVEL